MPIDILNEATSQLNLNSESNAKVFAMEVLEVKTYVLGKIQKGGEGSAPEVISLCSRRRRIPLGVRGEGGGVYARAKVLGRARRGARDAVFL